MVVRSRLRGPGPGKGEQPVYINGTSDYPSHLPYPSLRFVVLIARNQAYMTLLYLHLAATVDRTDHRYVGVVFQRIPEFSFVTIPSYFIEDDTHDAYVPIETLITMYQRRDAPGDAIGIQ